MERVLPHLQNTNAELTDLNASRLGQDQELSDRGVTTGMHASHGVDFGVDATNSLGSITSSTRSDRETSAETNYDDPNVIAQSSSHGDGFTGSMGRFSADSDEPGSENSNANDNESGGAPYA